MESVDNNQYEVRPNSKSKRKITTPCSSAYLNPALDLLATEDPICNIKMEIVPNKKRKRTRSCEIAAFENTALDTGVSRAAVNEFLIQELENVRKNMRSNDLTTENRLDDKDTVDSSDNITICKSLNVNSALPELNVSSIDASTTNPFLSHDELNLNDIEMDSTVSEVEHKSLTQPENSLTSIINTTNIQTNVTNKTFISNPSGLNLSFIDRLAIDSPNISNQSLYFDDDLNESNIMEIKTITIITKKKRVVENVKNTNPFLEPNLQIEEMCVENPFVNETAGASDIEYKMASINGLPEVRTQDNLMPRRLFSGDTNSTISTVNDTFNFENHEYENIDSYRADSPIYENINDETYNKQSKVLGHDVSKLSSVDILNVNRLTHDNPNNSTDKRDLKHHILKASNKLSKRVIKKLKKTFKSDKQDQNTTLNPYEVPRKPPKVKKGGKESGLENPGLKLDNSDEIEIEELDDDAPHYETIKTIRNTRLNMNVTPLKERVNEGDISESKSNTPGKKVRFDSTLNQEKVITGDSFDCGLQSPGFDAKINEYHDELENCINEKKFLQQNM